MSLTHYMHDVANAEEPPYADVYVCVCDRIMRQSFESRRLQHASVLTFRFVRSSSLFLPFSAGNRTL
jgi:hypothetical protein